MERKPPYLPPVRPALGAPMPDGAGGGGLRGGGDGARRSVSGRAIEGHDRLAMAFVRPLLRTDPHPIPAEERAARTAGCGSGGRGSRDRRLAGNALRRQGWRPVGEWGKKEAVPGGTAEFREETSKNAAWRRTALPRRMR